MFLKTIEPLKNLVKCTPLYNRTSLNILSHKFNLHYLYCVKNLFGFSWLKIRTNGKPRRNEKER